MRLDGEGRQHNKKDEPGLGTVVFREGFPTTSTSTQSEDVISEERGHQEDELGRGIHEFN